MLWRAVWESGYAKWLRVVVEYSVAVMTLHWLIARR